MGNKNDKNNILSVQQSDVVTTEKTHLFYLTKKSRLVLIFCLVPTILIIFFLIYNNFQSNEVNKAIKSLPSGLSVEQKSQLLSDKENYKAAQKIWTEKYDHVADKAAKIDILYQQSALALKFNKFDDANRYAKEIKRLAPLSPTSYVASAHIAAKQGNTNEAKDNWQKAIDKLNPNLQSYSLTKRDYQAALDSLK